MIYTFFSYKGGVGRSMALANIAELYYRDGLKVLIIDWDLEAPGLENYFLERNAAEEFRTNPGLAEMLQDYKTFMSDPSSSAKDEEFSPLPNGVPPYCFEINQENENGGRLWLLPAGRRDNQHIDDYTKFVRTFDWLDFYTTWNGNSFFEWFRKQVEGIADVVLIDSRTGLSEMGGVCTYQLADTVVMFCAPYRQSVDGTFEMARRLLEPEFQQARERAKRPLEVVVIPSRVEVYLEGNKLGTFKESFLSRFGTPQFWLESFPEVDKFAWGEFLWKMNIPQVPFYAFDEKIAVRDGEPVGDPLRAAYSQIGSLLIRLAPDDSKLSKAQLRGAILATIGSTIAKRDRSFYRVFISSPGDVAPERKKAFQVINDLNEILANSKSPARVEPISWEESIHAAAGTPQDVIKRQIPFETVDIFIAILWKRFGTPTGSKRPDDGYTYLSGTQQEIEEAYKNWMRTGRPHIMLYRKDHELSPIKSADDLNQLQLINDFFDQFKPSGKYPAFIKSFRSSEFESLLRRELSQVVFTLEEARDKRERDSKHDEGHPDQFPTVDPTEAWLKTVNLRENPFLHQDAEHDETLPAYFTRFPDLYAVTTGDITLERKSWFFFGNYGSGKTALRKFISARGRPPKPDSDMVCLEYDQVKFEHLLNNTDDINEFQISFVHSIFEDLSAYTGNAIQSSQPPGSLRGNLANLSVALREVGISWVLCLIDPGKAAFEWKNSQVATSALITSIFPLSEVGGYGFRYFLPASMKDELKPNFSRLPFNYIRVMDIKWDERTLRDMLGKRMTLLSVDQTAPYRSLDELCEDERGFSTTIDSEIASLAQGNPRAAIWLANRLIELHCEKYPSPPRIALETWDNVKQAWWSHGESRILGTSISSTFRVLSDRIYYQNLQIILSERSDRLLKALILAKGGFCSKQDLVEAGWAGVKNREGISEKALSEAMRRMKEELKKELETKQLPGFDVIKSVRGRGYRLVQPASIQPVSDGYDD